MKVAVIIDTWFPLIGGGQINAYEISRRIANKGVKIDIITRNNGKDTISIPNNLKIIKLGQYSGPYDSISKIIFMIRSFIYVYKRNYNLVHAHAFFTRDYC